VYESDTDFGQLSTIPSTLSQPKSVLLPSQKIDPESISHLTQKQQTELLEVAYSIAILSVFLTYLVMLMLLDTQSHSRIILNRNDYMLTEFLNV